MRIDRGRRSVIAAMVAALFAGATGEARAQKTPAQRADELNTIGKELFAKGQLRAAAEKFFQATVLSPEGRLYWNLCLTRRELNRLRAALTACLAVERNGAKDRVIVKSRRMIAELEAKGIKPETRATNPDGSVKPDPVQPPTKPGNGATAPVTNPGTTTPGTSPATQPAATNPGFQPPGHHTQVDDPAPALTRPAKLHYDYKWSAGFETGVLFGSDVGGEQNYADGGVALRFHADFMLFKQLGLGVQGYLHINSIDEQVQATRLQIYDVGGAVFKHFHLKGNLYVTPLIGVHLAIMSPRSGSSSSAVVGPGARFGVEGAWVFGHRRQYTFGVRVDMTHYRPAISDFSELMPSEYGLDRSSNTYVLALGLSMRFDTPFGAATIFTLE